MQTADYCFDYTNECVTTSYKLLQQMFENRFKNSYPP